MQETEEMEAALPFRAEEEVKHGQATAATLLKGLPGSVFTDRPTIRRGYHALHYCRCFNNPVVTRTGKFLYHGGLHPYSSRDCDRGYSAQNHQWAQASVINSTVCNSAVMQ